MRTIGLAIGILSLPQLLAAQAEPAARAGLPTLDELVARMRSAEGQHDTVQVTMTTRGSYPGGVTMRVEGRIRVLGGTHFQVVNRATFEDEITVESETVRTPDGVWRRERDPAFGDVYWKMGPADMAALERAREVLGDEAGGGFTMQNPVSELRGAAMLEGLGEHFDLVVDETEIDGVDYWSVGGEAKADAPEDPDVPTPDRIEILVRKSDLVVVRQTHFLRGTELMQVEIEELVLDEPLEKSSFAIALPDGVQWTDVRKYPPAWAQIEQLLRQAEAAEQANEQAADGTPDRGK